MVCPSKQKSDQEEKLKLEVCSKVKDLGKPHIREFIAQSMRRHKTILSSN